MIVTNILGTRRLYATVENHYYYVELPIKNGSTGRSLTLTGQTIEAHFLWPTELNLELHEAPEDPTYETIESDGRSAINLGEIVYNAYDAEDDVPASVYGALVVGAPSFSHILDLIKDCSKEQGYCLTVELSLFGLDLGMDIRADKWPNKRKLAILGIQFAKHLADRGGANSKT